MRTHKILALVMAMLIVMSSMSLTFAGIEVPGNDSIGPEYTIFNGSQNTVVTEGKYGVKHEPNNNDFGNSVILNLGNGYQIELNYDSSGDFVEWTLITPLNPDYDITIDWINVKGSNSYMQYLEGNDTTLGNKLYSVAKANEDGYHGISHVTILYQFIEIQTPPPPPDKGTLTIHKEVWIDEVEDEDNDTVFTFTVDGKTVTASAIQSGTIELEVGTYIVTETGFGDFTPETVTQQAILTTAGAVLTFVNTMDNDDPPPPPDKGTLTIHKEVWIDEVEDEDNDTVFTFTVDGKTVTASAIQSGTIELEVGTYIVTETGFGDFTPETVTQQAIITTAGAVLTFVNTMETENPPPPPPPPTTSSTTYIMSITKTANQAVVEVGETITYTITLKNDGTGTLTNVTVADVMVGLNEVVPSLAPGASVIFVETYIPEIAGILNNTATATDNQAPFVQASATVTVIEATIIVEETDVPLDVPEVEEVTPEPEEEIVIMEEETPLAIPDTGVNTPLFAYGAGALISLLGLLKKRR